MRPTLLILFSLLFNSFYAFSQIRHEGLPFYSYYPMKSFGLPQQAWWIDEGVNGFVYFATNKGLVEFDGKNWNSYATYSPLKCIKTHPSGRIYAGLNHSFGYFSPDLNQNMKYHSLSQTLRNIDSTHLDVIEINFSAKNICFTSSENIYIYNPVDNSINILKAETEFLAAGEFDDQLLVAQNNSGIYRMVNGELKPIKGGDVFKQVKVRNILPYDTENLLVSDEKKIYIFSIQPGTINNELTHKINSRLNLKCEKITSIFRVSPNSFGITSCNDGVYIFEKDGSIYQHFDLENILPTQVAWFGKETADGNIWVALENGILKLENAIPLSRFTALHGKPVKVNSILKLKNRIYIASSSGLYFREIGALSPGLISIDRINFKCTSLSYFVTKGRNKPDTLLLCATNSGLYTIKGNEVQLISEKLPVYYACQSGIRKDRILLATQKGFGYMAFTSPQASSITFQQDIHYPAENIIEFNNKLVWVSTINHGAFILSAANDGYELVNRLNYLTNYDINPGYSTLFENDILFNVGDSVGRYNSITGTINTIPLKLPDIINNNPLYLLKQPKTSGLWVSYIDNDGLIPHCLTHGSDYNPIFKRLKNEGILCLYEGENGDVWFGGENGLICAQKNNLAGSIVKNPQVFINKVSVYNSNSLSYDQVIPVLLNQNFVVENPIDYKQNRIKVAVTCSCFIAEESNQFSFLLEGHDREWSRWTNNNTREFTRLKEGSYNLHIKSRNIFDKESQPITLNFTIATPWFRSPGAYIFATIVLIILVVLLYRIFQNKYQREKRRLEKIILQRTSEILDQKSKIESQARQLDKINKNLLQLSIVARKTNNPVIITNTKGEIEWTNDCFQKYFNIDKTNLYRTRLSEVFNASEIEEKVKSCLASKKPVLYSERIHVSPNTSSWFQVTISPVLDQLHNVISLIIIFSDISNIVELNKIRDIITSVITHDLKSPLLGFSIFSKTLADNIDLYNKNQVQEGLLTMHNNASSIYNLLENLTDWFKSQRGEISFLPTQFDISVSINEVFALFEHHALSKKITLVNRVAPNSNVFADENMVRTILRNLLSNAIKFSDKGSIMVSMIDRNGMVEVSVTDEGVGVNPADRTKLFNSKDNEGFGLLICRELVNRNGGDIWYDDKEENTTFKFSLPKFQH